MERVAQRFWVLVAGIFVIALAIYLCSANLLGRTQSPPTAYFDHLADAFVHGRLYLATPPATDDLTFSAGRWYVPFPPLPALLLLPWVALSGVAQVNTVWFAAAIGAANVTLVFLLLDALARRGWTHLRLSDNLWLTALFGLGSVHWYMATLGSVWFVAQLCTATFMLIAVWSAVATGWPLLAGSALALAMLARPHVALCYPLLLAIGVQHMGGRTAKLSRYQVGRWAGLLLVPMAISLALLLTYNHARFGDAFDFGYAQQNVSPELASDLRRYGQFNLHYVSRNLWAMLLALPVWNQRHNQFLPTVDGLSLLLTTPALLYLARAWRRTPLVVGAWIAFGLLLIPLVTYYNTGWWQFGYRFSLDFMTPVMVLLAVAVGKRASWTLLLLILLGILVNAWGVWWFLNPLYFSFP